MAVPAIDFLGASEAIGRSFTDALERRRQEELRDKALKAEAASNAVLEQYGLKSKEAPAAPGFIRGLTNTLGLTQPDAAPAAPPAPMQEAPVAIEQPVNIPVSTPAFTQGGLPTLLREEFGKRGYSPQAIAGILGNWKVESGFDPANATGDAGTSGGLAQWHNERLANLKQFAAAQGADWRDPRVQVAFTDHELRTSEAPVMARLQSARTPQEAAMAFLGFERPQGYTPQNPLGAMHADKRLANAMAFAGHESSSVSPRQVAQQTAPASPEQALYNAPLADLYRLTQGPAKKLAEALIEQRIKSMGGEKDTPEIRNYNFYKAQQEAAGQAAMPFDQYTTLKARAGATNITNMVDTKGETAQAAELGKLNAKKIDEMRTAGDNAPVNLSRLDLLDRLAGGIQTGALAPVQAQLVRYGKAFGIPDSAIEKISGLDPSLPATAQAMTKIINEMTVGMIGPGGFPSNNFSDADRAFLSDIFPKISNEPEANKLAIEVLRRIERRKAEKIAAWDDYSESQAASGKQPSFEAFDRLFRKQVQNSNIFGDIKQNATANVEWRQPKLGSVPIPPVDARALRQHPELRDVFDKTYGKGASDRVLGPQT